MFRCLGRDGQVLFEGQLETAACRQEGCGALVSVGGPYCREHMSQCMLLELRHSTIPGAGLGLFAVGEGVVFRRGQEVCSYGGEPITAEEARRRYQGHTGPYLICGSRDYYEDGALRRGAGAMVNHAASRAANARFSYCARAPPGARFKLLAVRPILGGQEVLCNYGRAYRTSDGMSHATQLAQDCQADGPCSAGSVAGGHKAMAREAFGMQPATVGHGVAIRRSGIGSHAGNGLFATRPFARNSIVTEYEGTLVWKADAMKASPEQTAHHMGLPNGYAIAGLCDPALAGGKGGGSFANDGFQVPGRNNATFWAKHEPGSPMVRMFLKATRDIAAGEEIFVGYGRCYWRRRAQLLLGG